MAASRHPTEEDPGYTADPDVLTSDLVITRMPTYDEEPGLKPGAVSSTQLHPCEVCGTPVIIGEVNTGALVTVEPLVPTYIMRWPNKAARPRLTESRGYPAHQCRH